MKKYNLRPATLDDYENIYDEPSQYSIRAYVLEDTEDGYLYGIGGLVLSKGQYTIFLLAKPNVPRLAAWKAIKTGLKLLQASKIPVLAIRDPMEKTSTKLLNKLGFKFLEENIENEEVYIRWAQQQSQ